MIKSKFMIAVMTAVTVGLTYAPVMSAYAGDTFNTEDKIVTDIETVVIPTVPDTSIDVTVDDESEGPEITVEITPSTPSEPDVTTPSEADESTPSEPERSTHKTTGGGSTGGSGGGHAYVFPDDKKDDSTPVITPVVDSTPTPTPVEKEEPRKDKEEHKSELPPTGDESDLLYASCGLSGSMLMALMLHDRKHRMTAKS